jgi:hypothetical protein
MDRALYEESFKLTDGLVEGDGGESAQSTRGDGQRPELLAFGGGEPVEKSE